MLCAKRHSYHVSNLGFLKVLAVCEKNVIKLNHYMYRCLKRLLPLIDILVESI